MKKPERILLKETGFELYSGDTLKGSVSWDDVDKITAFKDDLVTFDAICIEFHLTRKDLIFEVNDDVNGFWDLVTRIKSRFPDSRQDWESAVLQPAYVRNPTVIYEQRQN